MNKRYLEVYKETQHLAYILAQLDGFEAKECSFNSRHKNIRIVEYFKKACVANETLNQHEMTDIVEDVEEWYTKMRNSLYRRP